MGPPEAHFKATLVGVPGVASGSFESPSKKKSATSSKSTESAGRVGQQKGSVRGIILKSGNLEIWNLRMCVCWHLGSLGGRRCPPWGAAAAGLGLGPPLAIAGGPS